MTSLSGKIYIISLATALLAALVAPRAINAKEQPRQGEHAYQMEVIARVDGIEITRMQLIGIVNRLLPSRAFHKSIDEERYEKAQKDALDILILNELIYKSAKEQNLDQADSKMIDAGVEQIKKRLAEGDTGDTLEKVLERSDMTMEDLRDDFKQTIVVRKMRKKKHEEFKAQASATVNDEYLLNYYDENPRKFKVPQQTRLRHILLKAERSGGQRVWNSVKKKALELEERALGGEDFAELAKQYSEGPNAAKGGDMGWAHKGSRIEELEYAASKLKKGEISAPVMTIYGYHLLKLEDIKPSLLIKFEDINKPKLKKELEEREYKRLIESWKTGLLSRANIEYLRELY